MPEHFKPDNFIEEGDLVNKIVYTKRTPYKNDISGSQWLQNLKVEPNWGYLEQQVSRREKAVTELEKALKDSVNKK